MAGTQFQCSRHNKYENIKKTKKKKIIMQEYPTGYLTIPNQLQRFHDIQYDKRAITHGNLKRRK
jgi:hypothetical protein